MLYVIIGSMSTFSAIEAEEFDPYEYIPDDPESEDGSDEAPAPWEKAIYMNGIVFFEHEQFPDMVHVVPVITWKLYIHFIDDIDVCSVWI